MVKDRTLVDYVARMANGYHLYFENVWSGLKIEGTWCKVQMPEFAREWLANDPRIEWRDKMPTAAEQKVIAFEKSGKEKAVATKAAKTLAKRLEADPAWEDTSLKKPDKKRTRKRRGTF